MRELLRDPDQLSDVLRRRILRGAFPAVRKLQRVARGDDEFRDDLELRACAVLARIAATLVNSNPPAPNVEPDWELSDEAVREIEAAGPHTREECAEDWADEFRNAGPVDGWYLTLDEAREFGRQQWDRSQASVETIRKNSTRTARRGRRIR